VAINPEGKHNKEYFWYYPASLNMTNCTNFQNFTNMTGCLVPAPPPSQWNFTDIFWLFIGIFLASLGYRFYKPSLFLGGFTLGSVFTCVLCGDFTGVLRYLIGTMVGLVVGGIALYLYPFGIFVLGFNWGVCLAFLLNGLFIAAVFGAHSNTALWVLITLLGGGLACLVLLVHRHKESASPWSAPKFLIISKTSWVGAYLIMRAIGRFMGDYPYELHITHMLEVPDSYLIYAGLTILLALIGTFVQMTFTHWDHCGCPDRRNADKEPQTAYQPAYQPSETQPLMGKPENHA